MSSLSQAPPTQHIPKEAHLLHIFPHHTLPDSHGQKNQTKKTGMQPSCLSFFLENGINTWPVYTRNQSLLSPLPPTCLSEIRYPKSCQFFHMFLSCCLHPHFVCVCVCSVVPDSATPWTVAHQLPLSMGFPKQEYWSGLPFPSLGDLPDPGIEPRSLALVGRFFTTEPPGKPPSSPLSPLYSVPSSSSCLFYGRSPALALLPSPLSGPLLCSQHE